MKLVIFGAGASFDSIHSYYDGLSDNNKLWKPPLAKEIFSNRNTFLDILKKYGGALSLKSEIMVHSDIEEYFQELWDFANENQDDLTLSKIINTQYFFQKLFLEISNNYSKIGDSNYDVISNFAYKYSKQKNKDVIFVSFNYDLLLENALERTLNIKFESIDDYLKHGIKFIKPHGSCNWFKNFKNVIGRGSVFEKTGRNNDEFINNMYENNLSNEVIKKGLEDEFVLRHEFNTKDKFGLPQLLIPLKNKDDFILPPNHFEYLSKFLKEVTEILIIGWKGTEEKFKNLLNVSLGDKNVEITVINNGDSTIAKEMAEALPNSKIISYPYKLTTDFKGNTDTFTNFIRTQTAYKNQSTYFFK